MSKQTERAMMAKIAQLERENTDLMTELNVVWAQLDRLRGPLMRFTEYPDSQISGEAKAALAGLG